MRGPIRAAVCVAALFTIAVASPAFADSPSGLGSSSASKGDGTTVVIGGREYGPKDGLRIDTLQFELEPGSGTVGVVFDDTSNGVGSVSPMATWGSSYAISSEWWSQLGYDGKAKAAANVYSGLRIIQVCIWYTRAGEGIVGPKICSYAGGTCSYWAPGPEVRESVWDSLDPFAPPTVFNIQTARILPQIAPC